MISTLTTLILVLQIAVIAITAFLGYRRGFIKSAIRLAITVVIGLVAFFAASPIANAISTVVLDKVMAIKQVDELLHDAIITQEFVFQMIETLIAPFIFAALFGFFLFIARVFVRKSEGPTNRVLGTVIGAVQGIVIALAIFLPLNNTLGLVKELSPDASEILGEFTEATPVPAVKGTLSKSADVLVAPTGMQKVNLAISDALFSTMKIDGEKVISYEEIPTIASAAIVAIDTIRSGNYQNDINKYISAAKALHPYIEESDVLSSVLAELIVQSTIHLEQDGTFDSVSAQFASYSDDIPRLFEEFVAVFMHTTAETLLLDIDTAFAVYDEISKNDVNIVNCITILFGDIKNHTEQLKNLVEILYANEDFHGVLDVVGEIGKDLAFTTVSPFAGVTENLDTEVVAEKISETLSNLDGLSSDEKIEVLKEDFADVLKDHGVDPGDPEIEIFATFAITYFESMDEITPEDVLPWLGITK